MQLSIKTSLLIGFSLLVALLAFAGCFGYNKAGDSVERALKMKNVDVRFILSSLNLRTMALNHRRYEKDLFLNIGNTAKQADYLKKFNGEAEATRATIKAVAALASASPGLAAEAREQAARLGDLYEAYYSGFTAVAQEVMARPELTPQQANELMMPHKERIYAFESAVEKIAQAGSEMIEIATEAGIQDSLAIQSSVILTLPMGIVVSALAILLVLRSALWPQARLRAFARAVAAGNLDAKAPGTFPAELEELRLCIEEMVQALKAKMIDAEEKSRRAETEAGRAREALQKADEEETRAATSRQEGIRQATGMLQGVVERLSAASEQLSGQIGHVMQDIDQQESRITSTATAMEEMNATVMEVARNAGQAADLAGNARAKALEGEDIVGKAMDAISRVDDLARELETGMGELGQRAQAIGAIMDVISDIADQTNLLALNAAIEAARAGEAGRGFAVVADEVRKLAEKTMVATKEVGQAIASIREGTSQNNTRVSKASEAVAWATDLARQSKAALGEIVNLVDRTTDQVRAIATSSEEQSAASEEITRTIEDMDRYSKDITTEMRGSSSAVDDLAGQARDLIEAIEELKAS